MSAVQHSEHAIVGVCGGCGGRMIEVMCSTSTVDGELATVRLECQEDDCREEAEIRYRPGAENPWKNPSEVHGVVETELREVSWITCPNCYGHGWVEDPICDLRRAMNGREHACAECHTTGTVPRVVEADGGKYAPSNLGTWNVDSRGEARLGTSVARFLGQNDGKVIVSWDEGVTVHADRSTISWHTSDSCWTTVSVGHEGRINLPAHALRELEAEPGDKVRAEPDGDVATVTVPDEASDDDVREALQEEGL